MSVYNWSKTAADNDDADIAASINWAEGQLPATVNNSARAMMAETAKWRDDTSGALTTGGSSNAYTLTTNTTITLANGVRVVAKANHSSTGAATLNVDSTGAKAIVYFGPSGETAITSNLIRSGGHYAFEYDTALASAAGAWVLLNPSLDKTGVGLGNVDNTSDANKPVSTATQAALDLKQNLDATLTAMAGVSMAADRYIYFTASDTATNGTITNLARNMIAGATDDAIRSTISLASSTTENAICRFSNSTGRTQDSAITIDNDGAFTIPERAAPGTPASGKVAIYAKSDGLVYSKDDAGSETLLSSGGASAATQAEQETASSNTVYVSPGRQQYHPSSPKAWVRFGATGTIVSSYNVSSVTSNGTGDLTVNFTTAFADTNYVVIGNACSVIDSSAEVFAVKPRTIAVGSCRLMFIRMVNGGSGYAPTAQNPSGGAFVMFFGDQ